MKTVTTRARLRRDERGQGLAEYAIAIGVITVAVIVAIELDLPDSLGLELLPTRRRAEVGSSPSCSSRARAARCGCHLGPSSSSIVPCRSHPARASQVRAAATGGGPTPAAGGSRHPANH